MNTPNNNLEDMEKAKRRIKVYMVILCVLSLLVGILLSASRMSQLKKEINQLSAELDTAQADLENYMKVDENIELITNGIEFSDGMDTHELYLFNKNYLNYIISSDLSRTKTDIEVRTQIQELLSSAADAEKDADFQNMIQSQISAIDSEISDLQEKKSEYEEFKEQTLGQLEEMESKYLK